MGMRFMSPTGVANLIRLIDAGVVPPVEITQIKEEIAGRTRATELRSSITGEVDMDEVRVIVELKLQFDTLCALWGEGGLGG